MKNYIPREYVTLIIVIILIITGFTPLLTNHAKSEKLEKKDQEDSEYYAVIAACTKYKESKYNIPKSPFQPYPEKQLKSLYNALLKTDNWDENNIILLINEQATKTNIINALENMSERVTEKDVFLFSWQGHGSDIEDNDEDEKIFNPNDTKDEVIVTYEIDYLTDDKLDYYFSQIQAKGMCLIFDCCLSGGFINRNYSDNDIFFSNGLKNDLEKTNINTLDVNKDNRVVIMGTLNTIGGGGVLSGFWLTKTMSLAFQGFAKDENNDGLISAEEAFNWAKPLTLAGSASRWISIWLINFIISLSESKNNPIMIATLGTILAYILNQISLKNSTGYFFLNWPNISDEYPGELIISQKW